MFKPILLFVMANHFNVYSAMHPSLPAF
jgi:hypothetical protein